MGAKTSKVALAKQLGISRSAMYYEARRPAKDQALREQIIQVMKEHPAYGHRRIAWELPVNKKRIARVMHLFGLRPALMRGRKFRYARAKDVVTVITPNRIKEVCSIPPNAGWVGDFTYLWFHGRYVYMATVMDSHTREIIAWQIGLHHTSALVVDVLEEAKRRRGKVPQFFHSDQGSEYTGHICVSWLVRHGITPSNSPKGKPWNNGRQESFYSAFKLEFGKPQRHEKLEQLIEALGRHIHYYNTRRIHSALRMPPRAYYEKTKYPPKEVASGV